MKKYIIIALLFLPVMSMAAPSVKKFGGTVPVASGGVKSSVASKVTPAKTITASLGANAARVGTVRLKPTATGSATSESTGSSVARFPVIPSLKVYNSAATPRPTAVVNNSGSSATVQEILDLQERVNNIETVNNPVGDEKPIITNVSTLVRHDDTISVGEPWESGEVEGRTSTPPTGRAWIWVEQ